MFLIYIIDGSNHFKYNGSSLNDGKVIGGSESALIYMAKALNRKFNNSQTKIKVFCNLEGESGKIYDGVEYYSSELDLTNITEQPDILIIQRGFYFFNWLTIHNIKGKYLNILWLEDNIHCDYLVSDYGKKTLNTLFKNNIIDIVITLSDHHTIGFKNRSIKNNNYDYKIYLSRNGIENPFNFNEISEYNNIKEDRYQIIYPSTYERGLENLVSFFPIIRKEINSNIHLECFSYSEYGNKYVKDKKIDKIDGINVNNGLSKKELWKQWKKSRLFIYFGYPSSETSCITIMEGIANSKITIHNKHSAVEETGYCGIGIPHYYNEKLFLNNFLSILDKVINDDNFYQNHIKDYKRITEILSYNTIAYEWLCYFDYLINNNIHEDAIKSELEYNKFFNRRMINYDIIY